jgi:DNA-binding transcriptional ArsR family regulator
MPRLTAIEAAPAVPKVEFMFSPSLDMLNAMYFTRLVIDSEGVEGWPVELRRTMSPDLLAELDFLYTFPNGEPGLMGQFGDVMFGHPEVWDSIPALIDYVRNLPLGVGESEAASGVQGFAFYLSCIRGESLPPMDPGPREALRLKLLADGADDVEGKLALWDRPEELRERMVRLIERFYEEHYKAELPRRRPALERSAAAHRGISLDEANELIRKLTGRPGTCLETSVCPGPFDRVVFMPSLDMGPYLSCADIDGPPRIHGMIYPCEPEFTGVDSPDVTETQRMARIYKALGDEQRLRMLHMLRGREMYAQEIVEALDLHQSVVSRHLSFLRAVGLLQVRKQNNMKFFSLNPEIQSDLGRTIALFGAATEGGGSR